jgi:hypothetical protein
VTRRCLICANINPCREHSQYAQDAELGRNMREIAVIEARAASAGEAETATTVQQGVVHEHAVPKGDAR